MTTENNTATAATDLVQGASLVTSPFEDAATLIDRAVPKPERVVLGPEHQILMLPNDWSVHDISKHLPPPDRIRQNVTALTLQAFIDYVTTFVTEHSVVFADESQAQYEAVLDYHPATDVEAYTRRGTSEHVAKYACPKSDQWVLWTASNGKQFSQVDFARFLEDNLVDVAKPPAADLLQIVLQLQVKKAVEFTSDLRLDNGQTQLSYEEKIRGTSETKRGNMQIPDGFTINISVFVDGPRYPVNARLRYRLEEAKLRMWYELERSNDVFRAAVKAVSDGIRKELPDVAFFAGKRG
jgi:uncharacterized protein YfdQ (DUF2303 family)